MTRAVCVRTDAVRLAAVAGLLTSLAVAGCSVPLRQPAGMPPPPAYVQRVATLRVGLPAPRRGNLLFTCEAPPNVHQVPRIGSASYASDTLDPTGRRWLRVPDFVPDSTGALAPDTLVVRAFGDATDEEIALERGELDVAVFWPGELSARMRADEHFRDPPLGLIDNGVLACERTAADSLGPPRADMEMLNREAFGGDLLPWSELAPDSIDGTTTRYTVDPTLPGAKHLERVLARIPSAGATRLLKLTYVDEPRGLFTTQPTAAPRDIDHVASEVGVATWIDAMALRKSYRPLFAIRCPVVTRPGARAAVHAIGASVFAKLAPCAGGVRRPSGLPMRDER